MSMSSMSKHLALATCLSAFLASADADARGRGKAPRTKPLVGTSSGYNINAAHQRARRAAQNIGKYVATGYPRQYKNTPTHRYDRHKPLVQQRGNRLHLNLNNNSLYTLAGQAFGKSKKPFPPLRGKGHIALRGGAGLKN